jgi:hypothetical protein
MAFEETSDLLAFCRRAGIRVSSLFLNMASLRTKCPTCRALAEGQSKVRLAFHDGFTDVPQTVIYRCAEPRGPDGLTKLGRALYRKGARRVTDGSEAHQTMGAGYHG